MDATEPGIKTNSINTNDVTATPNRTPNESSPSNGTSSAIPVSAPAPASAPAVPSSTTPTLQDRIQTLTDIHARLTALRHVPSALLKPPSSFPTSFDVDREFSVGSFSANPAHDLFQTVTSLAQIVRSEKVQDALRVARESEEGDKSDLGFGVLGRGGRGKRKRPLSPVGSPQPYVPPPVRSSTLFSPPEDDPPPLRAESLIDFVRSFNRGTLPEFKQPLIALDPDQELPPSPKYKLVGTRLSSPTILQFTISDVLTAYVSLIFGSVEEPLVVENVTAFGPRERYAYHTSGF
ncbi:hypothetical protein ID866_5236 [Astraeus odoratus]|nr:hypothetical protein ID866_5236 [Astraeus odoratus]